MEAARSLKEEGNVCFREKRFHKAIQLYTESLQANVDPLVLGNRAQSYLNVKNWTGAIVDCNMALQIDSKIPKALYRRGVALDALGLHSLASLDIRQSLALIEDPATKALLKKMDGKKNVEVLRVNCCEKGDEVRSTAPLRDIPIDYEEEVVEEPIEQLLDVASISTRTTQEDVDIPQPADNYPDFVSHFKQLSSHPTAFSTYFLTIPFSSYSRLFDDLLEAEAVSCLLSGFTQMIQSQLNVSPSTLSEISACLLTISTVSRFDMITMFMGAKDLQNLHSVCSLLGKEDSTVILTRFTA